MEKNVCYGSYARLRVTKFPSMDYWSRFFTSYLSEFKLRSPFGIFFVVSLRWTNSHFRPSRSLNESLPEKYHLAELFGLRSDGGCDLKYAGCNISALDLFSEEW